MAFWSIFLFGTTRSSLKAVFIVDPTIAGMHFMPLYIVFSCVLPILINFGLIFCQFFNFSIAPGADSGATRTRSARGPDKLPLCHRLGPNMLRRYHYGLFWGYFRPFSAYLGPLTPKIPTTYTPSWLAKETSDGLYPLYPPCISKNQGAYPIGYA